MLVLKPTHKSFCLINNFLIWQNILEYYISANDEKEAFFGYWIFNVDIVFRIQYSIITLSDTIGRKHYLFSLDNRIRFIEI